MLDNIKAFIDRMNKSGIPVFTIRDPKTQIGSVTLTLVFISSLMVILSLIGSIAQKVKGIDVNNAMEFFLISLGAYLGRKMQTKGGNSIDPESKP